MQNKKRLTIEIDQTLHAQIKSRAYAEGKTIRAKIEELLQAWLGA